MVDAPPAVATGPAALSAVRRNFVLAAMCLALVMVISGVAMLNNALPHIAEALGLSQSSQQWVVDGYTLALAALLLPAGALGDRFGRRRALLTGVVVLGLGSLLAATAHSAGTLIAARAVSGAGAALIMPGTLSTITSVFPPEGRAKAVGIWAGFAFSGGTLGMFISGALVDNFYWGSIFLVTAGAALLTLLAVITVVPETKSSERVGLDPVGALLSAAGIGAIVLAIIEGPVRGWTDMLTVTALIAGAALVVGFVRWEASRENPLLDPRLFKYRGFATGSASLFLLFLAMFGFFFVGVQYLQLVLGYGALKAAVAVLPMSLVALPVSAVAASLSERLGQRAVSGAGFVMAAAGLALLSLASADTGYWLFLIASLILAVGVGLSMTPATNAIVKSLPAAKQGVASAVNDTAREIGSAFGVAILGSAFNIGYRNSIDHNLGSLPSGVAAGAHEAPAIALRAAGGLGARGVQLVTDTRVAFMSGLRYGLVVAAISLLIGALYVAFRSPSREAEADVVDGGDLPEAEEAPVAVEVPQVAAAVPVGAGASEP